MWVEQNIQTKIQKYLEKKGFMTINLIKTNRNWIPDLIILNWNGKCFFIEVKKIDWIESKLQEFRRKELIKNGYISLVVYWYDDFLTQYNKLLI